MLSKGESGASPFPSKGPVQLQWFELADELYYLRVVLLIHKSSKHI